MLSSRTWRTCTPSNCWANFRAVSRRSWRIGLWGSWSLFHTAASHPPLHAVAPIRLKHPRQTSKPTSQLGSYPTQKVIFASESNKNCLKYTFCLFPDHSIFQGTKKLDSPHLAFLASKQKLNVHQTCHTWNPCECKHFRPPSRVALLPGKLRLPALKHTKHEATQTQAVQNSVQLWENGSFSNSKPVSSFHLDNCDHFAAPQTHQARRAQPCVVPAPLPSLRWPPRSPPPPPRPAPAWHGWSEAAQKRPGSLWSFEGKSKDEG